MRKRGHSAPFLQNRPSVTHPLEASRLQNPTTTMTSIWDDCFLEDFLLLLAYTYFIIPLSGITVFRNYYVEDGDKIPRGRRQSITSMKLHKARGDTTVSSKMQTLFMFLKKTGMIDIKAIDVIQKTGVMIVGFLNQMLL